MVVWMKGMDGHGLDTKGTETQSDGARALEDEAEKKGCSEEV